MRPSKVCSSRLGGRTALVSFGLTVGGTGLVWAHATQRDADGYYATSTERFETPTYALTSERIDLGADVPDSDWSLLDNVATPASSLARSTIPHLRGIARHTDVERFLATSSHDELTDVAFDPFKATYSRKPGETPGPFPASSPLAPRLPPAPAARW